MSVPLADDGTEVDIEEAVRLCQHGDVDAFDRIFAHFHLMTFRTAYRMLGTRERAEDAVQDIYLKAWSHIHTFRTRGAFSAWLHTIAVDHCLNLVRCDARERQRLHPTSYDRLAEEIPSPHRAYDPRQKERDLVIHEAVSHLPEKLRVVIVLLYFTGCSLDEVAAELGIPRNTVRTRYRLARERLRRLLGGWEG